MRSINFSNSSWGKRGLLSGGSDVDIVTCASFVISRTFKGWVMVGLDTYGVVGNGKRLGDLGDEFRDLSEPNFVRNWREQIRPNVDTPPASRASPQQ